jgi:hypothetical protein
LDHNWPENGFVTHTAILFSFSLFTNNNNNNKELHIGLQMVNFTTTAITRDQIPVYPPRHNLSQAAQAVAEAIGRLLNIFPVVDTDDDGEENEPEDLEDEEELPTEWIYNKSRFGRISYTKNFEVINR